KSKTKTTTKSKTKTTTTKSKTKTTKTPKRKTRKRRTARKTRKTQLRNAVPRKKLKGLGTPIKTIEKMTMALVPMTLWRVVKGVKRDAVVHFFLFWLLVFF